MAHPDSRGQNDTSGPPRSRRLHPVPAEPLELGYDAETIDVETGALGRYVDPPVERVSTLARLLDRVQADRTPLIAPWLLNKRARAEARRQFVGHIVYSVLLHLLRLHIYAGRVAKWAPVGFFRLLGVSLRWAAAEEGNWYLRQAAARSNNPEVWMQLNRERQKQARFRWPLLGGVVFALALPGALLWFFGPWWAQGLALVVVLGVLARIGRPQDKPLTERVTTGRMFTRLTAEMVRTALVAIGVQNLTDPAKLRFPQEIHRDGPGWLARVNLPPGVEAVAVLERRGKLSSALQLPLDQVWPSAGPDHAGQLDLWVGYRPASKMGQPPWSLASPTARVSVFEPFCFASDPRARSVATVLFARNFLIGGVPGSGKSYGARTLAIGAALDPIVELKIAEFKGTADFADLGEFASTYICGVDDQALDEGAQMIYWGLAEAERRGRRIAKARERGEAPHGKVTPELAARPGSGLHPVVFVVDEAHELLADRDAAKALERLIKRGRALALIVVLATQVADKDSVPPIITRCVNMRWAMAVPDYIANDQLLGTGAYRRGLTATSYRPEIDAGWGVLTGLAEPTPARSQFPDEQTTRAIMDRIRQLRGGVVVGARGEKSARRDVVADLRACFRQGEPGLHWEVLAERLADVDDSYEGVTAEIVSAQARAKNVPSVNVNAAGSVLKGTRLKDLVELLGGGGSGE